YATPGTAELSAALAPLAAQHDAFLLAHHGAVTLGAGLQQAYDRMTTLEHTARILLVARLLGGARPLGQPEVERLLAGRTTEPGPAAAGSESPELARRIAEAVLRHLGSPEDR
ncbi:MAG: hypothetical protein GF355_16975, partial [Candidatus Eisenbacteria bacterium]|nr:hypothetical protein [Candidatus Eisenbacteria bacterium]